MISKNYFLYSDNKIYLILLLKKNTTSPKTIFDTIRVKLTHNISNQIIEAQNLIITLMIILNLLKTNISSFIIADLEDLEDIYNITDNLSYSIIDDNIYFSILWLFLLLCILKKLRIKVYSF